MTHPYSPPPVGREQEGEQEGARGKPSSAAQQGKEWLFGIAKRMVGSLRRATMGLSPEVGVHTAGGSLGAETRASEETAAAAVLLGTRGAVFDQDSLNLTVFLMGRRVKVKVAQSCATLCNPIDGSIELSRPEYWRGLPFPSPVDLPNPGIRTGVSCITGRFFTNWAMREAPA